MPLTLSRERGRELYRNTRGLVEFWVMTPVPTPFSSPPEAKPQMGEEKSSHKLGAQGEKCIDH